MLDFIDRAIIDMCMESQILSSWREGAWIRKKPTDLTSGAAKPSRPTKHRHYFGKGRPNRLTPIELVCFAFDTLAQSVGTEARQKGAVRYAARKFNLHLGFNS